MLGKKVTKSQETGSFDPSSQDTAFRAQPIRLRPFPRSSHWSWRQQFLVLAAIALLGLLAAAMLINRAIDTERSQMLAAIHGRADSLVWALEGSVRSLGGKGSDSGALAHLVAEVARQPGIAWIVITDAAGHILADSNPELTGETLYAPEEMRRLAPGSISQGRFSPDDPSIYEIWRLFAPGRLRGFPAGHESKPGKRGAYGNCIFVGLDVTGMEEKLEDSEARLWFVAVLVMVAALAMALLAMLLRRYRSSRRLLADAEALAAQVVQNYPAGLMVLDRAGRVLLCNARARAMLGLEKSERGDAPAGDSPKLAETGLDWFSLMDELEKGVGLVQREQELYRLDAAPLPIELAASRIHDSNDQPLGYLFSLRDLGEIRSLQRRLRQHERLSALGNLAAGLAHEIRNPLSSIRGYATYLAERLRGDALGLATSQILIEETERLDRVLSDLLNLARPRELARQPTSLGAVLSRVLTVAAPDAAENGVRLYSSLVPGNDLALIDADRLMQAVLNLVINAIQATDAGGEVEVALDRQPEAESDSAQAQNAAGTGAPMWRIRVRDTGCGMAADTAAEIFTPYFTTKANGTGLGLSLAQQTVELHGGVISASSLPGRGTTITILLPGTDCQRSVGGPA